MYNPRVIVLILLTGIALLFVGNIDTTPTPNVTTYSSSAWVHYGDDNRNGKITEGESGWRCWSMGNRKCSVLPLSHR